MIELYPFLVYFFTSLLFFPLLRYNLKLKLKKLPTVTEQEFLELALNVTTKEL